jgi:hypothetical protein
VNLNDVAASRQSTATVAKDAALPSRHYAQFPQLDDKKILLE